MKREVLSKPDPSKNIFYSNKAEGEKKIIDCSIQLRMNYSFIRFSSLYFADAMVISMENQGVTVNTLQIIMNLFILTQFSEKL